MQEPKRRKSWLPYILGVGLVFFVIHSPAQPGLTYNAQTGEYGGIFLPYIGFAMIVLSSFAVVAKGKIDLDLGPKWAWIPLVVIVASMTARLIVEPTMKTMAGAMFGASLFVVYLACRKLGEDVFKPIAVAVVIEAISLVVIGLFVAPGIKGGGIISYPTRNYDIATGFLVFGSMLAVGKRQWLVVLVALVGLIFTGAEEAMVVVVIIGVVVMARSDWGRKLFIPIGVSSVLVVALFGLGLGHPLYESNVNKIKTLMTGRVMEYQITPHSDDTGIVTYPREFIIEEKGAQYLVRYDYQWEEILDNVLNWRWSGWKNAIVNIQPLGHGYEVTKFNFYTVHNVPLIIVDQIGVVAALAWVFLVVMGLVKTKWKYAFVAVIALSLLDHYIWTQMSPWFPALVGVATASPLKSDLIFRRC